MDEPTLTKDSTILIFRSLLKKRISLLKKERNIKIAESLPSIGLFTSLIFIILSDLSKSTISPYMGVDICINTNTYIAINICMIIFEYTLTSEYLHLYITESVYIDGCLERDKKPID